MSHEIRTPMNSIVGFSELALDDDISDRTKDYLNNIRENSGLLLSIINDILDISKIESGKMEMENVPFDIQELLSACRSAIMPKALEKDIKLIFYSEPILGKKPQGDPVRLRQILINLLSNAVKFTHEGTVKLTITVKEKSKNSMTILFEVKDIGIGITPSQIENIFDPFIQAESGTTRKYGGSGLGLPITNNLVNMMGGTLLLESTPGLGSRFSFEATFETKEVNGSISHEDDLLRGDLHKPTFEGEVLVCEDNNMNQQVIRDHLARVGLKTVVAENGKIGVEMVENRLKSDEKQFDLIFMDMHMPVMDGFEATEQILGFGLEIPIVAMTANVMAGDREIYMTSGMRGYVGKPFTSQELWRCLLRFFKPVSWQTEEESQQRNTEKALRQKLINSFVQNNLTKYENIMDAINKDDIKLAHRLVHTLKSNAGQLDFHALQEAAAEVEEHLSGGDSLNLTTVRLIEVLAAELDAALTELTPLVSEESQTTEDDQLQTNVAWALFKDLEPLLIDGDVECLNYIEKLRLIPGSEDLIRLMEDYDFEPASVAFAELKDIFDRRSKS